MLGEMARGNPKPLAIYLGIAPVAGELVGSAKDMIKDGRLSRGENGFARHLQNMLYVGGAGMLGDLWQGAIYEQLLETGFGPTISDLTSWAEHMARRDMSGFTRDLERLPVMRVQRSLTNEVLPFVGSITSEYVDQMIETYGSTGENGPEGRATSQAISPAELIRRQRGR